MVEKGAVVEEGLRIELRSREIRLQQAAQDVLFEDIEVSVRNAGQEPIAEVAVRFRVTDVVKQTVVMDLEVPLQALHEGKQNLLPGEEIGTSLYRLLQENGAGLASRIHLFGYKAALGWEFRVETEAKGVGRSGSVRGVAEPRVIVWRAEEQLANRVVVEMRPA